MLPNDAQQHVVGRTADLGEITTSVAAESVVHWSSRMGTGSQVWSCGLLQSACPF